MSDQSGRVQSLDDGFGNTWSKCDRVNCGMEIVRPGKIQCWCDTDTGPFFLAEPDDKGTEDPTP